ncbi:nuclear transport factor 2 family protein [Mycobacterium bourgelatii]|uniref:SnoaL-like domain-containing protein n=1 Tax=Mycobacterium bourgelatii TaxID=1273442 RepID=A0A7I9YKE7_MYCBU|nr:limonene-1,2-epoxide hydrolase family protein [Mycobacterium bourgelatii]MCV6973445.1 nuclear transport factor 2 family protein [Mycobacterium bourgelatii]GFG88983.1 hypothetical protein MBOU_10250 [Mycobacterium bourgelatii]
MDPEQVVLAELKAWERRDVDEIVGYFSADATWSDPNGTFRGSDEIRKAVEGYVARMEHAEMEVVNIAAAGNVVLTERVDRFVYDGRNIAQPLMGAFEVADGKITAWRDYYNMPR